MTGLERFPVLVRHAIESLFGEPPEAVAGRSDDEQARKRAASVSTIRFLEDYFISRLEAAQAIPLAWNARAPFCLFLRSFDMGQRVRRGAPGATNGWEFAEWLDTSEPAGGWLLHRVGDVLGERALLVAIANPAEWLPHRQVSCPFANLVVADDVWYGVVTKLMDASQMIVVHRAEASHGVDNELKAIRAAGRVGSTLVVREALLASEPDAEVDSWVDSLFGRSRRRAEARGGAFAGDAVFPHDPALEGFEVMEWRDDEALALGFSQAVDRLLGQVVNRTFDRMPAIELPPPPADEAAQYLLDARRGYELAGRVMSSGDLRMGEELLFECFATSCAADELGGRASACLELGRLLLLQVDSEAAVVPLEYASGHFIQLAAAGGAGSRARALEATHLYAAATLISGDFEAAGLLWEGAGGWEVEDALRRKLKAIWREVERRAADPHIALFARNVAESL